MEIMSVPPKESVKVKIGGWILVALNVDKAVQ